MSSYLHTLQNLQKDHSNLVVVQKTSVFGSYQDYLHRRSRKHLDKHTLDSNTSNYIDTIKNPIPIQEKKSQIKYYPRNQKIVEYHQIEVKTTIPKKRTVTNYVEKKQVELVPKEVTRTDYFAVEHVRGYIKEIVPEVKIEKVTVPKKIRNIEIVPVEKQIIYYPPNKSNIQQIKRQATEYLTQSGVLVRQDAEFKPQTIQVPTSSNVKVSFLQPYVANTNPIFLEVQSRLKRLDEEERPYFALPRRSKKEGYGTVQAKKSLQINKNQPTIPIYQKQNYKIAEKDQPNNISSNQMQEQKLADYSFAQRDNYRYELLTNSYFGKNY